MMVIIHKLLYASHRVCVLMGRVSVPGLLELFSPRCAVLGLVMIF